MTSSRARRHGISATDRTPLLQVALVLVCVLLVLMAGGLQLLHQHAVREAPGPGCSLCVVAHLSSTVTPVLQMPVVVTAVEALPLLRPLTMPARVFPFDRYVRPPPAGNA